MIAGRELARQKRVKETKMWCDKSGWRARLESLVRSAAMIIALFVIMAIFLLALYGPDYVK